MAKRSLDKWTILSGMVVYVFLYFPLIIVVVDSFKDIGPSSESIGFATKWYNNLLQNEPVVAAATNSLVIAFVSSLVSTTLGTLAGLAMHRYQLRLLPALLFAPIAVPELLMGVSLLLFFVVLNVTLGMVSIILAHVTFCIFIVALIMRSRLASVDDNLVEAARDLGATPIQAFTRVTLPLILPGIIAGALLAFALSINDFVITFFVGGASTTTLPVKLYTMMKTDVTPEVNAISTILMSLTFFLFVVACKIAPGLLRHNR
jgi:spermidine/putrescine transport system permease protein